MGAQVRRPHRKAAAHRTRRLSRIECSRSTPPPRLRGAGGASEALPRSAHNATLLLLLHARHGVPAPAVGCRSGRWLRVLACGLPTLRARDRVPEGIGDSTCAASHPAKRLKTGSRVWSGEAAGAGERLVEVARGSGHVREPRKLPSPLVGHRGRCVGCRSPVPLWISATFSHRSNFLETSTLSIQEGELM